MTMKKFMKPWMGLCAALAAISCGLMATDIGRILGRLEGRSMMRAVPVILWVICGIGAVYSCAYLICRLRNRDEKAAPVPREERKKEWVIYLCVIVLITLGLFLQYGNLDISRPMLTTDGDEMGVYALTKSIIQNGTSLITPQEGGPEGTDMFDYPYSDKLSFLIVKVIGLFTQNPYTVVALFFFLNHYLAALSGLYVCRKLKFSRPVAAAVAVLYGFSPYIELRFSHMWLTSYYLMPLACLMAIYVVEGKVFEEGVPIRQSATFRKMAAVSFACAFTGLYYAYFTCAILAAAMVIRAFAAKERKVSRILYPSILILITVAGVMANVIPNFVYWHMNGMNMSGEMAKRVPYETEYHALKFTRLLMPRANHRIPILDKLSNYYHTTYPLNSENITSSLGLIPSVGFLTGIIMLLVGRKKYRTIGSLNMSLFLIGTVGGIGSLISVFLYNLPIRCYNRVSILMMFLSLLIVAMLLEQIAAKNRKVLLPLLSAAVILVGYFDQVGVWTQPNYEGYNKFHDFIDRVEEITEPGDTVFMLPYDGWPRSEVAGGYRLHYGYLESEDIIWSYGAMDGRQTAAWEQAVSELDPYEMIENLRAGEYKGLFMDVNLMHNKYWDDEYIQGIVDRISLYLGEPIATGDDLLLYWTIGEENVETTGGALADDIVEEIVGEAEETGEEKAE